MKYVISVALVFFSINSYAENSFSTYDVRVIDGDTIEVIPPNNRSERVRLLGIDAPESDQIYGAESTASLKKCVTNNQVTIQWLKRDQYDRIVGKVWANNVDCNLNQLSKGMAWHYKYYAKDQPVNDRKVYSLEESNAKSKQIGLWADPNPINPYNFRKGK